MGFYLKKYKILELGILLLPLLTIIKSQSYSLCDRRNGHKTAKFIVAKIFNRIGYILTEYGQPGTLKSKRTAGMTTLDILCVIGFECLTDFYNGIAGLRMTGNCWESIKWC